MGSSIQLSSLTNMYLNDVKYDAGLNSTAVTWAVNTRSPGRGGRTQVLGETFSGSLGEYLASST